MQITRFQQAYEAAASHMCISQVVLFFCLSSFFVFTLAECLCLLLLLHTHMLYPIDSWSSQCTQLSACVLFVVPSGPSMQCSNRGFEAAAVHGWKGTHRRWSAAAGAPYPSIPANYMTLRFHWLKRDTHSAPGCSCKILLLGWIGYALGLSDTWKQCWSVWFFTCTVESKGMNMHWGWAIYDSSVEFVCVILHGWEEEREYALRLSNIW